MGLREKCTSLPKEHTGLWIDQKGGLSIRSLEETVIDTLREETKKEEDLVIIARSGNGLTWIEETARIGANKHNWKDSK